MSDKLLCERNGVQQWFTRRSWEVLGDDKLGWVEVQVEPPTPKEVVTQGRVVSEVPAYTITARSTDALNSSTLDSVTTNTAIAGVHTPAIGRSSMPGNGEPMEAEAPKTSTRKPRSK